MTDEELKHIQAVCRGWLRQPGTANRSRMTIPAGGALSRTVEVVVGSLLTFDNVLFMAALDAETSACYTTMIVPQGQPEEFIDTPLDKFLAYSTPPVQQPSAPLRATQQRYHDAMQRLAESSQRDLPEAIDSTFDTKAWLAPRMTPEADRQKFLLYTNQDVLGHSFLEHERGGQRNGRFYPDENYFEYASIFEAFPEAENYALEANAREAYELFDEKNEEYRNRFNELSAQIASLGLYVTDESGRKLETSELRLEDLSRYYDDQLERWLYVTLAQNL